MAKHATDYCVLTGDPREFNEYHIGASLKDFGKKWFAFAKMKMPMEELIGEM
ncbi:MAG: hypothetical protein IJM33_05045 [Bacteroidales bacterium]|nr:hypothetical protein [Bacteroidales bacterium]MBR3412503.1 hypothetical protein [Bacteroidales bacterium]